MPLYFFFWTPDREDKLNQHGVPPTAQENKHGIDRSDKSTA